MVEKLKKYRCTYISDQGNKFDADAEESNEGEFFKVVDVEAILNSHQQSKQCQCVNSCVSTIYVCKDCGGRVNSKR